MRRKAGTVIAAALALAACSSKGAHPGSGSDGGPTDGGVDAGPLACPPAALDEFGPAYRHAQAVEHVCNTLLINDFYNSCLGPAATSSGCAQNWGAGEDTAHTLCQACLITPADGMTLGPLIDYGNGSGMGTVSVNVAGCVELLDPTKLSCATSVQDADECQHAACDASCPVTDDTSFANWQACIGAAAQTTCASYLTAAACVNAEDAGPAATCVGGSDFESEFLDIATVFCGGSGGD